MPQVRVAAATEATEELVSDLARLVPQLSSSAAPGRDEIAEIVASPATTLLVARDERGSVMGTLTLVTFRVPTALRVWIEDVVVDSAARRQGVAEALVREAMRVAEEKGARTIELTSRPSREDANRLYKRLGFEQRDTNVYRYNARP